ncbi:putative F-box protein At1g30930 isoform X2 [Capsella rubella]|uniref:putative F-box protein At1g30930 isoform X2 n=1 Tax=Capsella rubella TaxID=81985 RepID=UPI000CD57887|nr:putative F-box protein At1g30930 isoform X2 [Capsella rubella]
MENSIPIDLIIEILSRLPEKSASRFRCVSKQWKSLALTRSGFHRDDFSDLLTRSSARPPRLLFGVAKDREWSFYSTLLPQNPYDKSSSLVVSAAGDFHTKFSKGTSEFNCSYASGLIYFHRMCIPREDEDEKRVIYNPLTGQYVILPELRGYSYSYLGFDPVDKEFKVLFMSTSDYIASSDTDHYILTLGARKLRWRKIRCPFTHEPVWDRICINGVLYYLAIGTDGRSFLIVCFDVRTEKFKFICTPERYFPSLINYKGKLCLYDSECCRFSRKLSMLVLEDVEKEEWTTYSYKLRAEIEVVKVNKNLEVVGVTASGDIVLSTESACKLFYVFYYNPGRNTLQSVEIQGVGDANRDRRVYTFADYAEDLSVDDAMKLKSIPLQPVQNVDPERPEPRRRTHISPDLSKSPQSVKCKEQNKCESSSANMLYLSLGLASVCLSFSFVFFYLYYSVRLS